MCSLLDFVGPTKPTIALAGEGAVYHEGPFAHVREPSQAGRLLGLIGGFPSRSPFRVFWGFYRDNGMEKKMETTI